MKFIGKKLISILLVLLLLSSSLVVAAEEELVEPENGARVEDGTMKKDQTVYVVLANDGSVDKKIIMNRLFDYVGDTLIDTGEYLNIKAISQNIEPEIDGDQITWKLLNDDKDFYYEGEVSAELPVSIQIKYYLDGEEIELDKLAGSTGELKINIVVKQNAEADYMHTNAYLTQLQLPLDLKRVKIIEAPKAMQIVTGTIATISYSIMPDSDADHTLTLDVKNFEMDAIQVSLISYDPMDEDQYKELTDGLLEMEDGTNELNKGTGKLRDGLVKLVDAVKELADGLFKLADGGDELQDGMNKYYEGLIEYRDGMDKLADGLGEASDGLGALYSQSSQLVSGYSSLYSGLRQLQQGFAGLIAVLNPADPVAPVHDLSVLIGVLDEQGVDEVAQQPVIIGAVEAMINEMIAEARVGNLPTPSGIEDLEVYVGGLTLVEGDAVADGQAKLALLGVAGAAITAITTGMLADPPGENPGAAEVQALIGTLTGHVTNGAITLEQSQAIVRFVYEAATYGFWQGFLANIGIVDPLVQGPIIAAIYSNIESAVTAVLLGDLNNLNQLKALLAGLGVKEDDMDATIDSLLAEVGPNGLETTTGLLGAINSGLLATLTGFSQANAGLRTYFSYMGDVVAGIYEIESGMSKLKTGTYDLTDAYGEMIDGSSKFFEGIHEAADGADEMHDSIKTLPKDVNKLIDGQKELKDGIIKIRKEFDKKYDPDKVGRSFSFVVPDEEINSIQFIMLTPEIKYVKETDDTPVDDNDEAVWYERIWGKVKYLLEQTEIKIKENLGWITSDR